VVWVHSHALTHAERQADCGLGSSNSGIHLEGNRSEKYGSGMATLPELTNDIRAFADSRDWAQFHTTRNLLLALVGEVGELAAEVQWVGDAEVEAHLADLTAKARLESEIADVAIYLLRLCDVLKVDLEAAIQDKLKINETRYPVERARGSAAKYTEL
jgi:dCTP diphosphatase